MVDASQWISPPDRLSRLSLIPRSYPPLGGKPLEVLAARDYLVVYGSEEEVKALQPDMAALSRIDRFATIVTAPGADCDFVSRFFAPAQGIPEDPVTGSSHCTLTPYWAKKLGKTTFMRGRCPPEAASCFAKRPQIASEFPDTPRCFLKDRSVFSRSFRRQSMNRVGDS